MNLPEDIAITKIDAAVLIGKRPRIVGRNARLGMHGQTVRDPIVRLHTDAGIIGWGWSAARPEDARQLIGKRLSQVFDPVTGTEDAFLMFDLPLWDLAGRVLGQSFHDMLGDAGCDPVPVYDGSIYIEELHPDTGQDDGVAPMLRAVRMGIEAGFHAFKVKVGRGFRWMEKRAGLKRDIGVLRAIRELIGPEMKILIDANNGYTPSEAREVMRQAGDCDIYWFEEPFPEDAAESTSFRGFLHDEGWRTLLADGEGTAYTDDAGFTRVLRAGGVDVVQFDFRGYTATKFIQYLPIIAETGALVAPHNWASHLTGFYIAQFGRGCQYFVMGETDIIVMPGVIADGYELIDGMMRVPDTPGLGLELDPAVFSAAQCEESAWCVS